MKVIHINKGIRIVRSLYKDGYWIFIIFPTKPHPDVYIHAYQN